MILAEHFSLIWCECKKGYVSFFKNATHKKNCVGFEVWNINYLCHSVYLFRFVQGANSSRGSLMASKTVFSLWRANNGVNHVLNFILNASCQRWASVADWNRMQQNPSGGRTAGGNVFSLQKPVSHELQQMDQCQLLSRETVEEAGACGWYEMMCEGMTRRLTFFQPAGLKSRKCTSWCCPRPCWEPVLLEVCVGVFMGDFWHPCVHFHQPHTTCKHTDGLNTTQLCSHAAFLAPEQLRCFPFQTQTKTEYNLLCPGVRYPKKPWAYSSLYSAMFPQLAHAAWSKWTGMLSRKAKINSPVPIPLVCSSSFFFLPLSCANSSMDKSPQICVSQVTRGK